MDIYIEQLLRFRDLEITKTQLKASLPLDFKIYEPIKICNKHVISLLENYNNNLIDKSLLLDWVNTIWFSDWYEYCDENEDCIASIMNELEEIDEVGHELNSEKIVKYINALENNIEI